MLEVTVKLMPPAFDHNYASLDISHRTGGMRRGVTSRDTALKTVQSVLDRWSERDDYDVDPAPSNTELELHPDYEGELTVRELFGDATLAAFGAGSTESRFAEKPWYTHQPEFDEWLRPVLESDGEIVLEVTYQHLGRTWTRWVRGTTNDAGERDLEELRYRHTDHRLEGPEPADQTKIVRSIGAYGPIYPEPYSVSFQKPSETGFEGEIDYLEGHPSEVNGWVFYPDDTGMGDVWLGEGTTNAVRVYHSERGTGGRFVVEDTTVDLADRRIAPDGMPESRIYSELTTSDAREQAIRWMEENPPETWCHPQATRSNVRGSESNHEHAVAGVR